VNLEECTHLPAMRTFELRRGELSVKADNSARRAESGLLPVVWTKAPMRTASGLHKTETAIEMRRRTTTLTRLYALSSSATRCSMLETRQTR
jgi:hypothetical protein